MRNQIFFLSAIVIAVSIILSGCSKEEDEDNTPEVSASNFTATIAENPVMGQVIGTVSSSIKNAASQRFFFTPEHVGIAERININSDGVITVSDSAFFDYEKVQSITGDANVEIGNNYGELASASFTITIYITDVYEAPSLTIQQRLDNGESPSQIYNSDYNLLDSLYGKTYVGGLIAYLNTTTGNGFVAATIDQSSSLIWDPNQPAGSGTVGTNTAIGNGPINTTAIVSTIGVGNYAAQICNDLVLNNYSDWYLPCKDELTQIYNNLHLKGLGNFQNTSYWSSSETNTATIIWYRKFDTGQEGMGGSEQLFAVRAARTF